ncbi:9020_t:CDS:2, partial [Scutellospora calospora]
NISTNRLKKDKMYKPLKGYPFVYRRKEFNILNPLWMPEEQLDNIRNIELIIGEYKESLFDKLSITQKNIDTIQSTLSEMMGYYETEKEKRNFLELTVEVLVNGNIEVDDIEDESIRNILYIEDDEFKRNEPNISFGHFGIYNNHYLYLTSNRQQLVNIPNNFKCEFIGKRNNEYITKKIKKMCFDFKEYFNVTEIGTYTIYKDEKPFRKITSYYKFDFQISDERDLLS